MSILSCIESCYCKKVHCLSRWGDEWLLGLSARFVFVAVLFVYYWSSAKLKVGAGLAGFFEVQDGAYYQILSESVVESFNYDIASIPWYLDAVVYMGTYAEFLLPVLIVLGLFTRVAALGMIGFVIVQSIVDITLHGLSPEATGHWFDRFASSEIMDQRLLWILLYAVLVIKGAGKLSLDALLVKLCWRSRAEANTP